MVVIDRFHCTRKRDPIAHTWGWVIGSLLLVRSVPMFLPLSMLMHGPCYIPVNCRATCNTVLYQTRVIYKANRILMLSTSARSSKRALWSTRSLILADQVRFRDARDNFIILGYRASPTSQGMPCRGQTSGRQPGSQHVLWSLPLKHEIRPLQKKSHMICVKRTGISPMRGRFRKSQWARNQSNRIYIICWCIVARF